MQYSKTQQPTETNDSDENESDSEHDEENHDEGFEVPEGNKDPTTLLSVSSLHTLVTRECSPKLFPPSSHQI